MIVTCPACRSRYRCADQSQLDATAHCSACDERFPLTAQRQSYRLAQAGSSVAATLTVAAVGGASLPPSTPPADGVEGTPAPDPLLEGRPPEVHIDLQPAGGELMPVVNLPMPDLPLPEMGPSSDEAENPEPGQSSGWLRLPQTLGELLVALVPATLGGGLAYYFAGPFGQSPSLWAALGATMGLLFGWACLLWITRED
jgi:hypothetical protein